MNSEVKDLTDQVIMDTLPHDVVTCLPKQDHPLFKTITKHLSSAVNACNQQNRKKLSQSIVLLRHMLNDESCSDCHEFIYKALLYFCDRCATATFPDDGVIPTEFLLLTVDQHRFDIRSLVRTLKMEDKQLINPISQAPFFIQDQQRIFNLIQEKGLTFLGGTNDKTPVLSFKSDTYIVIKRNGSAVDFSQDRIDAVVRKAMLASDIDPSMVDDKVSNVTHHTLNFIQETAPNGGVIHIETIQNCVERALMSTGERDVARAYILYRDKRNQERQQKPQNFEPSIRIQQLDGSSHDLDKEGLRAFLVNLASGLKSVDASYVLEETYKNLYDGISYHDINSALIMVTRPLVEQEPEYSYFAARLLKHRLCEETLGFFQDKKIPLKDPHFDYSNLLSQYIHKGIEFGYLSPQLAKFDLTMLTDSIDCTRDNQLSFFSLQTLYDRYFIHHQETRLELPQIFFMRIAMGLSLNEGDKMNERAIEYYNLISSITYMCATPTLFNSGTNRSQLSSCFLLNVEDDLHSIFDNYHKCGSISKWAGGLGVSWTKIRSSGAYIKGTNGKSSGLIPFLNIADAVATAVNQGGKRKGAVCAYLETWHLDIYDFLDLRKNSGDERRRTHDMNTANWIPDLFMKRVIEKGSWTLFSPNEVPLLHNTYGLDFEKEYVKYEKMAAEGKIMSKTIEAAHLWRKMLTMLYETGHPWITFKCPTNIRNPQQHVGDIHSSNLCTEITLNTNKDEIAVCNLGSINLANHITKTGKLDTKKLKRTIKTAIRMLDNVIELNYYSVDEAKFSNMQHRPIGLGMMGFQDALYRLGIPYDSDQAVEFADELMEIISYHAIESSIDLAKERGAYPTFKGSLWDQGILPIDSIKLLKKHRGELLDMDMSSKLDWQPIRDKLAKHGMRNSNVLAIAPTATIANISNTSQSIEPMYMNLAVKSTLSGEFTIVNRYLVDELKALNLWDDVMVKELKYYNGSIQKIERIPAHLRETYKTAFEIDPLWLIRCASRRQKWIDQSQSLNLYVAGVSGKKLDQIYKSAWQMGLKTTYYLRAVGASDGEKSTLSDGSLNKVKREEEPSQPAEFCSIDNPDCESCQ